MKVAAVIGMVLLGASVGVVGAQVPGGPGGGPGGGGPDMQAGPEEVQLAGTVQGFNYSPRGMVESLMLTTGDGKVVQLNFPPEMAGKIGAAVKVGDKVEAAGMAERGGGPRARGRGGNSAGPATTAPAAKSSHGLYRLASLTTAGGKTLELRPDRTPVAIEGEIKGLNYSRDGVVNGFVLGDGKVVMLPPGAEEVSLTVGQKIAGEAVARPAEGAGAVEILEAMTLDGKALRGEGPPRRPGEGGGPPNQGGPGGPPPQN